MVKRIWFPNSPIGVIDTSQRLQLGLGYPQILPIPVEPTEPPIIIDAEIEYYRRYLNDPLEMILPVSVVADFGDSSVGLDSEYLRRYLNDPLVMETPPGRFPTNSDFEPGGVSEFDSYFRRYLNDPQK